jgi:hypothetical protein
LKFLHIKIYPTLQEIWQLAAVLEGYSGGFEPPQNHIAAVLERLLILASAIPYIFSWLIDDRKSLLSNYSKYLVGFARQQINGSALVRAVLSHASCITFYYILSCIATFILNEIS